MDNEETSSNKCDEPDQPDQQFNTLKSEIQLLKDKIRRNSHLEANDKKFKFIKDLIVVYNNKL